MQAMHETAGFSVSTGPAAHAGTRGRDPRLLVLAGPGTAPARGRVADLDRWLSPGDLLVLNDAATLPASFRGRLAGNGAAVELRLLRHGSAGSRDLQRADDRRNPTMSMRYWLGVLFGDGDWRTPTEHRVPPPRVAHGDRILLTPQLEARVTNVSPRSARLVELEFRARDVPLLDALLRAGRPIQYAHQPRDLDLAEVQTRFAVHPVALEAPSASFPLRWDLLLRLEQRGIRWTRITHATGVSSTGDPAIDGMLPFPERYWIGPDAAAAITTTRERGGRVVAVGTGVTRALETVTTTGGIIEASTGISMLRLGPDRPRQVVDGLLTGMHESGSSHLDLLSGFAARERLGAAYRDATENGFLWHEFGDLCLILP